jgi:hypothetical protein
MSLKTFEMFLNKDFSDVEEVSIEEFNEWDDRRIRFDMSIYKPSELMNVIKAVEKTVISNIGLCDMNFEERQSFQDENQRVLGVIILIPNSFPSKHILIKMRIQPEEMDFGVIIADENTKFTFRGVDGGSGRRLVSGATCYLCYGYDGLNSLFQKLAHEETFIKPKKTPKPYKNKPLLTEEDFAERGISGQSISQFYKDYGTIIRNLNSELSEYPEEMEGGDNIEFRIKRKKALQLLDNWISNS